MTPKEAELVYGKENVEEMWDFMNLESMNAVLTPEGLDIPTFEWDKAHNFLINRKIYKL